jgi:hypothetical protein
VSAIFAAPASDFVPAASPENHDFAGRRATCVIGPFFENLERAKFW